MVKYIRISAQEALRMMEEENVIILDVRTLEEFEEGFIEGAILLPYYDIWDKGEETLPDKDQIILIYCRRGRRSAIAARTLIDMGYTRVYDFGGIDEWEQSLTVNSEQ